MSDVEDDTRSNTSRTSGVSQAETSLKKRTPRASKKDLDILRMEFTSFQGKMSSIDSKLEFLQDLFKSKPVQATETATLVGQIPDAQNRENIPPGECRPILPLYPTFDEENVGDSNRQDDELSLQPGQHERRVLQDCWGDSDRHSVISVDSNKSVLLDDDTHVPDRFAKYSKHTSAVLAEMFGEDAITTSDSDSRGIVLDGTQIKVLEDSWRCSDPSKLTAYKESYRTTFPISNQSEENFSVPSLDNMIETLLVKKYGSKSSKPQSLCSQPLRSLEKLAYQGQHAARMGLIINTYMQQALSNFLSVLKGDKPNIDSAIQCVRDIFAMSTKSLDQMARSGAFHHLIRRRAAMADTGLQDVRDVKDHIFRLPFSHEGVFGSGLEKKLKERKELNNQLSDLLPETDRKRKLPSSTMPNSYWKKPRFENSDRSRFQKSRPYSKPYTFTIPKVQDRRSNTKSSTGVSYFRNKNKST